MSILEVVAFLLGLTNVALVVRRSIWNYPFALALVSLYAWIFWREKLYSDALLQLFFFAVNLYGWWYWARSIRTQGTVVVERLSPHERVIWLLACALATIGWGALMHGLTDASYPWWDASVAMMSVAAQILQSRRRIESWLLWIAVDLDAIGLYAVKGLALTAVLYGIFGALSVWGLIDWHRTERKDRGHETDLHLPSRA